MPDVERLREFLAAKAGEGGSPLWIVLIGHGTYDGKEAKFNLRGPDVTDLELSQWLDTIKRPVAVLDCTSASGPFLNRLSGPGRVIVTATRSGDELNFARFGQYLAETIADPKADLDKDGQVSLLEAFLTAQQAGRRVLQDPRPARHRARPARRQRRPPGHARRLVPGRPRDQAGEGRGAARRPPRPPAPPDPQRPRAGPPRGRPPPPRRARAGHRGAPRPENQARRGGVLPPARDAHGRAGADLSQGGNCAQSHRVHRQVRLVDRSG